MEGHGKPRMQAQERVALETTVSKYTHKYKLVDGLCRSRRGEVSEGESRAIEGKEEWPAPIKIMENIDHILSAPAI